MVQARQAVSAYGGHITVSGNSPPTGAKELKSGGEKSWTREQRRRGSCSVEGRAEGRNALSSRSEALRCLRRASIDEAPRTCKSVIYLGAPAPTFSLPARQSLRGVPDGDDGLDDALGLPVPRPDVLNLQPRAPEQVPPLRLRPLHPGRERHHVEVRVRREQAATLERDDEFVDEQLRGVGGHGGADLLEDEAGEGIGPVVEDVAEVVESGAWCGVRIT